jgi:hypothetical protein
MLFVPPETVHPGLMAKLPFPRNGGERIEVSSVSAILELVENDAGAGLVPGYYWLLEESAKRGRLVYTPLAPLGKTGVAAYVPAAGEHTLPDLARALLAAFRKHLGTLQFSPSPQSRPRKHPGPLAASLERYTHQYYVSCHPEGGPACKWYVGEIHFTVEGGEKVTGTQTDYQDGKVVRRYLLEGAVVGNGLLFHAKRDGISSEHYSASFIAQDSVLLGMWHGQDDFHSNIWAPMVLSILPLSPTQLKQSLANIQAKFPTYIDATSLPSND